MTETTNAVAAALPTDIRPGLFRRLMRRKTAVFGAGVIALVVLGAVFAPQLAQFPPDQQNFDGLTLEGAPMPPNATYWFGTDLLGRDLFSRLLHGARTSLIIGVVANGLSILIGTAVGVTAGVQPSRRPQSGQRVRRVTNAATRIVPQLTQQTGSSAGAADSGAGGATSSGGRMDSPGTGVLRGKTDRPPPDS